MPRTRRAKRMTELSDDQGLEAQGEYCDMPSGEEEAESDEHSEEPAQKRRKTAKGKSECANTGVTHIDFSFRRRLCFNCRKEHLFRFKPDGNSSFDPELFDLGPHTKTGAIFGGWSINPVSFWRPQLEAMQTKVTQFKENMEARKPNARQEYDDFRRVRALDVRNTMHTVKDLEAWVRTKEAEQFHTDEDRRSQGYNAIVDRLVAAGYDRHEVPSLRILSCEKGLQMNSVRPLTKAAWAKMASMGVK
ncbi:hypothetical protein B0H19DRAFT_1273382 [Mycena capillaripes]|nr:hypothetical protein B0H19DRAFT_1273382 [Mycena capillaripes]